MSSRGSNGLRGVWFIAHRRPIFSYQGPQCRLAHFPGTPVAKQVTPYPFPLASFFYTSAAENHHPRGVQRGNRGNLNPPSPEASAAASAQQSDRATDILTTPLTMGNQRVNSPRAPAPLLQPPLPYSSIHRARFGRSNLSHCRFGTPALILIHDVLRRCSLSAARSRSSIYPSSSSPGP